MNVFQMQLLYFLCATGTVVALGIYGGVALIQARRKHFGFILVWLLPFFVGNILSIIAILIQDYHFFTGTRATRPDYILTLSLPIIAGVLGIYGYSRLGKIVASTTPLERADFAGVKPDPTQEGPWLPPNEPAN